MGHISTIENSTTTALQTTTEFSTNTPIHTTSKAYNSTPRIPTTSTSDEGILENQVTFINVTL